MSEPGPSTQAPGPEDALPSEPIDRLIGPLERFLHVEAAGGIVLLACTAIALALANSPLAERYLHFWEMPFSVGVGTFQMSYTLHHWINDGLMTLFFFVVGLEVKREIVLGELGDLRRAALPIFAALGGMLGPAALYLYLQRGEPAEHGWGIPMATDIAFVVGCMALLSPRVPAGLRALLLSLAIADDIGAIVVIAVGYTEKLNLVALGLGFAGLGGVYALRRLGVRNFLVYLVVGALVWFAFHESGVHATIAGVLLGLLTPARSYLAEGTLERLLARAGPMLQGESSPRRAEHMRLFRWASREVLSPLEYLLGLLHPWVAFVIMPLFALANAGVVFRVSEAAHPVALAVVAGLVLGKPLGILLASGVAVLLRLARLPDGVSWKVLAGGGCLAGIGFTMALFITGLALEGPAVEAAKVGILEGSAASALLGMFLLARFLPRPESAGTAIPPRS